MLEFSQKIAHNGLTALDCQFRQIEGKLWEVKIKSPQKELDAARKRMK